MKQVAILAAAGLICFAGLLDARARGADQVLVEAESFADPGGWTLDTQFIEIMGSPYLLAHGLGRPVEDAATTVSFPSTGVYRVFVRTKDWVARWKAPGTPGRFQLLVDGKPLDETFGTKSAEWFWHDGGTVEIAKPHVAVRLHDLTGFDGRCDAILFTKDLSFTPPNDSAALERWRRTTLGLPEKPEEAGPFDLVVIGGGYAGCCAAISAARMGCKVALIQDRPVLGGNGSSEIRVWPQGKTRRGRFPRLGEIVEELATPVRSCPGKKEEFGDEKKEKVVRAEKNLLLCLNHHAFAVEKKGDRIAAVLAQNTKTSVVVRFTGKYFADCTGHGTIGFLAGADSDTLEKGHMGMSNMWRWATADRPRPFPETPWALDLEMEEFPYPTGGRGQWFWESGFDRDPIADLEYTRDLNLRAVFGAFNAMKNRGGAAKHKNAYLQWVAAIGGNRESRRLMGDVVLTKEDVVTKRDFPDGCVPSTWSIDLHYPRPQYAGKFPKDPFISIATFDRRVDPNFGYPIPYRCFYSRNVPNLFMAGRCISVTHEALGTVRVMKTCGMMGEVVGKAASICTRYDCTPRDVYRSHLDELKDLMKQPGRARRATVDAPIEVPGPEPPIEGAGIDPRSLPGLVLDDPQANCTGRWAPWKGVAGYVGNGYLCGSPHKGTEARYDFKVEKTGRYEVRLSYTPHENRASNAAVSVHAGNGLHRVTVNQRTKPPLEHGFASLGVFPFEAGRPAAVVLSTEGADGLVVADAVQVVPAK